MLRHPFLQQDVKTIDSQTMTDLFEALSNFSKLSLSHKTLAYFSGRNISEPRQDVYDYLFDYFDDKNTGTVSFESFKAIFQKHIKVQDKDLGALFKSLDIFEIGQLTYSLFVAGIVSAKSLLSDKGLRVVFELFDIDRSGTISLGDIEQFLTIQLRYKVNIPSKFKYVFVDDFLKRCPQNVALADFISTFRIKG